MRTATKKRLLDAIEACEMIERRTAGLDFAAFVGDGSIRDGVVFRLLVIGEALNAIRRTDPTTAGLVPGLEMIVAMRHRLVHAYAEIDDRIVWDAATELGPLHERLVDLLGERPTA